MQSSRECVADHDVAPAGGATCGQNQQTGDKPVWLDAQDDRARCMRHDVDEELNRRDIPDLGLSLDARQQR